MSSQEHAGPALWGGPECSIVRVGGRWRDQLGETGHYDRDEDIARIAALGIRTVRYPILWERIAPERADRLDFGWTDRRLAALQAHGIEVIGGLLHHGSGPHYTDLLDPDFPEKLADFAARVGARYPQVRAWTPVNEPLTTARFSGLYGHWYPHRSDYPVFLRALVNQCRGIRLAMAALRTTNSDAALIQTEDLGKTFATPPLQQQADHENARRWLSLDLLCGRVTPGHPLFRDLIAAGIAPAKLEAFGEGVATPDVIGVNHYLTSERFLDHSCALYPGLAPGGNGRDTYVDAEAVRIAGLETGLAPRLREAWKRYRLPLALTEVHHGCTRDEQLRWFAETLRIARAERDAGMDLRAVTLWSLFGNVDWRSLLTREDGHYDPGAFDIRGPTPRATALAHAAKAYTAGDTVSHPVLDTPGWWRRTERLYTWCGPDPARRAVSARPILITGATGTLGQAFARVCAHRGLEHRLTDRQALRIDDPDAIEAALRDIRPWAVINAAGFVRVADAGREAAACMAANGLGPELLGQACAARGIPLVAFSSDLVFDGLAGPYEEDAPVSPVETYGKSKAEAERRLAESGAAALIVRTSAFFGPWDRHNFAWHLLSTLAEGRSVRAGADIVSPTFVPDLCHAVLDLLIDGETGIWHLANEGAVSWHAFACRLAGAAGLDRGLIVPAQDRPVRNTALRSARGRIMRPLDEAIAAYLAELDRDGLLATAAA